MDSPNLKVIQRTLVIDAKRNLYAAFLSIPPENLTESDLNLMNVLMKDDDIQNILNQAFSRNKN
jgi:hypothetical protein